jgi:hypothetical protein
MKELTMGKDMGQHVDTSSAKFKEGVEAGLNSPKDTQNWQAGNELGEELKNEGRKKEPVSEVLFREPSTPLFMEDSSGGDKGNPQDEKDETEE